MLLTDVDTSLATGITVVLVCICFESCKIN